MFRLWVKLPIVLLLICVWQVAAAQTPANVIVILKGQEQTLSFQDVHGASVGNVNVVYLQDVKPNVVVIFGSGVGESSLEVNQRDGRRIRLTVRVLSVQPKETVPSQSAFKAETLPQRVDGPDETNSKVLTKRDEITNVATTHVTTVVTQRVPPAAPIEIANKPSTVAIRGEMPRPRDSFWSRLQFSVETTFVFDREDLPLVSADLMDPPKLQQAVFAKRIDKLVEGSASAQVMTLRRSSTITSFSIVYPIKPRNSLTLIFPYIQRQDEIMVGGSSVKARGKGLGDIQARFARSYPRLFKSAWEGTVELGVGLPTGKSIYNVNAGQSPVGIGHTEVSGVISAQRTFDSVTFNASLGISSTLPRTVQGVRMAPGLGYSMQTAFGYALSDRVVLSEQMSYTRSPNFFLSIPTDVETVSANQAQISHSLIITPKNGHSVQAMFNLGLTQASSDYGVGFRYIYQRKSQTPR